MGLIGRTCNCVSCNNGGNKALEITTVKQYEHYVIYVNSNFWSTCENWREVNEEIAEIERIYSDAETEVLQ